MAVCLPGALGVGLADESRPVIELLGGNAFGASETELDAAEGQAAHGACSISAG